MVKYYCDWCNAEPAEFGGKFTRRVGLPDNPPLPMNVVFTFEFNDDPKPDHLCLDCYIRKIEEATKALRDDVSSTAG